MPYIQLSDRRMTLGPGENPVVGGGGGAFVTIDANGNASIHGGDVRVNGVALHGQTSPLLHGDKIEVGSEVMSFGGDTQSGSTQYLSRANIADLLKAAGVEDKESPTLVTGGRLVSMVDGREYQINTSGFTMGRDPGCDVVIASGQVSRSHAEIELGSDGYYIIDTSTNGVYVNGRRVEGTQTLKKGDVVRIAEEEFRFYADDVASKSSAAPVSAPSAPAVPVQPVEPPAQQKPPESTTIPAPKDAARVPVTKQEEEKPSGLSWWIWLLVALILVAGAYFVIQGR